VSIDRMQRTRSLHDSTYLEPTWIGQFIQGLGHHPAVVLIPYLQRAVDSYYPGTKLAVTEYSYYADHHISGGIAQADFFGAAGRHGLYMANRWYDVRAWARAAFLLYRDCDGAGGAWGDVSVRATTSDVGSLPAYASFHSEDSTKLHLMLINRNYDSSATVAVAIQGQRLYDAGECWYLGRSDSLLHHESLPSISGNAFGYTIPPLRACHLILWNSAGSAGQPGAHATGRPFEVYPNPARILSQLKFSRPGTYLIYDVAGRLVTQADGRTPIEARVSSGIYFVWERKGGQGKRLVVVR
jgi:hypothetical protein